MGEKPNLLQRDTQDDNREGQVWRRLRLRMRVSFIHPQGESVYTTQAERHACGEARDAHHQQKRMSQLAGTRTHCERANLTGKKKLSPSF